MSGLRSMPGAGAGEGRDGPVGQHGVTQGAGPRAGPRGVHRVDWRTLLPVAILLLGALLYLQRSFQFFLHDDEGTYAYAVWRVSTGDIPYRDFLTSEMPLFLYWGGLLVRVFGRSFVALRLATMAAMLGAGYLLYRATRELLGRAAAAIALALFLIEPNVFRSARFFRAEALMLFWQMAALYVFVLGEKRERLRYTALAGLFSGL